MSAQLKILISHAYDEKELADAWKTLLDTLSAGQIEVWFSSDLHANGGVPPGVDWHADLERRLLESNFVLAIQTPGSLNRTWIMWECGLAYGAQQRYATEHNASGPRRHGIIPLAFGLPRGGLLNPLNMYQVFEADSVEQVQQVCASLLQAADLTYDAIRCAEALEPYFQRIHAFHLRPIATPEEMSLWRERFERLLREGTLQSDLLPMRSLMYASFGPDFKPLDLSLHDMLSSLLLSQENYAEALQEIAYARQLAPTDLRLLHRKALTLLETREYAQAELTIQEMSAQNPDLLLNAEIGSLQGRILREHWLATGDASYLEAALQAYRRIYEQNKRLYFPGINTASLYLYSGRLSEAETIFQELLRTCLPLQMRPGCSYWVDFTIGEAYLGLGKLSEALAAYRAGLSRDPAPSLRECASARSGVQRMAACKELAPEDLEPLLQLLQG